MVAPAPQPPLVGLADLARVLHTAASCPDVVELVVRAALDLTGADSAHVSRFDLPHGMVRVLRNAGELAEWEQEHPNDESYQIADLPQTAMTVEEAGPWCGAVGDDGTSAADQALLEMVGKRVGASVPVVVEGQVWGEIYLARVDDRPFTDDEVATAELLGALAGAAVMRLEGHEQVMRLALTDPLTGLANRRAVDQALETWAADADRSSSMTVVLCDVNGLKQVNDQHGHPAGDRLLREIGGLVSVAAGRLPGGLAARLGGDEFLIASPDPEVGQVAEVVQDLAAAARALKLGGGLSCGIAAGRDLPRAEPTPTSRARSLMKLADAEQYRHKLALRQGQDDVPERWTGAEDGFLVTRVSRVTDRLRSPEPVVDHLATVAAEVCSASSGAAWWVSTVDVAAGTVVAAQCGTPRPDDARDGEWPDVELDPTVYLLADYPATQRAIGGRSIYVDSFSGDASERHLLAQTGFSSLVAAGGRATDGSTWLVEIYGDAFTTELHRAEPLLQALTSLALQAPTPSTPGLPLPRQNSRDAQDARPAC
ncbi:hypothetical protein GCM10027446_27750 [Angustibacter peucedani]